jgi:hypothetical protein
LRSRGTILKDCIEIAIKKNIHARKQKNVCIISEMTLISGRRETSDENVFEAFG